MLFNTLIMFIAIFLCLIIIKVSLLPKLLLEITKKKLILCIYIVPLLTLLY
jgi:hypothetical protein